MMFFTKNQCLLFLCVTFIVTIFALNSETTEVCPHKNQLSLADQSKCLFILEQLNLGTLFSSYNQTAITMCVTHGYFTENIFLKNVLYSSSPLVTSFFLLFVLLYTYIKKKFLPLSQSLFHETSSRNISDTSDLLQPLLLSMKERGRIQRSYESLLLPHQGIHPQMDLDIAGDFETISLSQEDFNITLVFKNKNKFESRHTIEIDRSIYFFTMFDELIFLDRVTEIIGRDDNGNYRMLDTFNYQPHWEDLWNEFELLYLVKPALEYDFPEFPDMSLSAEQKIYIFAQLIEFGERLPQDFLYYTYADSTRIASDVFQTAINLQRVRTRISTRKGNFRALPRWTTILPVLMYQFSSVQAAILDHGSSSNTSTNGTFLLGLCALFTILSQIDFKIVLEFLKTIHTLFYNKPVKTVKKRDGFDPEIGLKYNIRPEMKACSVDGKSPVLDSWYNKCAKSEAVKTIFQNPSMSTTFRDDTSVNYEPIEDKSVLFEYAESDEISALEDPSSFIRDAIAFAEPITSGLIGSASKFDIFTETLMLLFTGPGKERPTSIRTAHVLTVVRNFLRQIQYDPSVKEFLTYMKVNWLSVIREGDIRVESSSPTDEIHLPEWILNLEDLIKGTGSYSKLVFTEASSFMTNFAMMSALFGSGVNCFVHNTITYKEFMGDLTHQVLHNKCGINTLLDIGIKCVRFVYVLKITGSLNMAISHSKGCDEVEFFELQDIMNSLNSPIKDGKKDYHFIRNRLTRLQQRFTKLAIHAKGPEKVFFNARLRSILEWKNTIDCKIIEFADKPSPFCITLYGAAGVGKTACVKKISSYLHKLQGLSDIEKIGTSLPNEKYDSNLDSDCTAILLDDLGNTKTEFRTEKSVTTGLIRFVQPITATFIKADVESKGKCLNNAQFVFITSNRFDGDGCKESNSVMSVSRRLGIKIEVVIKKEHMNPLNGTLDPATLHKPPGSYYLPYWVHYNIYEITNKEGKMCAMEYLKKGLDGDQLLCYLKEKCQQHFLLENKRLLESRLHISGHDFCEHSLPICACVKCRNKINNIEAENFLQFNNSQNLSYVELFMLRILFQYTTRYRLGWLLPHAQSIFGISALFISGLVSQYSIVAVPIVLFLQYSIYERLKMNVNRILQNIFKNRIDWIVDTYIKNSRKLFTTAIYTILTISLTGFLYKFFKKFFFNNIYKNIMVEQELDVKPKKVIDVINNMDKQPDSWAPVIRVPAQKTARAACSGSGLLSKIKNNMFLAKCTRPDNMNINVIALVLDSNSILLPSHIWYDANGPVEYLDILLHKKHNGLNMSRIQRITFGAAVYINQDKDFCIIGCKYFGSRFSLVDYINVMPPQGEKVLTLLRLNSDSEFVEQNLNTKEEKIPYDSLFEGVKYLIHARTYVPTDKNQPGWCGSLLIDTQKGISIVGIHVAGDSMLNFGVSNQLRASDIYVGLSYLKANHCYITPTDVSLKTTYLGKEMELAEQPHKNNPISYLNDMIEFYGDSGKSFTPGGNVQANPYVIEFSKNMFMYPYYSILNRKAFGSIKPLRAVLELSNATTITPNQNLIKLAVDDYLHGIESVIEKTLKNPHIKTEPLTVHEALNGIDGSKYFTNIKCSTSAGFPFDCKKSVLIQGADNCFTLRAKYQAEFDQIVLNMYEGKHSGLAFKSQYKDEPVAPHKVDSPRVFFCGPVYALILMRQYLSPAIAVINSNPAFFETSIGLDVFKPNWHERVSSSYAYGSKCLSMDFKKYDQTQCPTLSIAAASVILKILKLLGYNEIHLKHAEYVCNEFLTPIINVNGAFVLLNNLHPSGYLLTAHLGGIKGSIAMRASFYKSHGVDPGKTFKDYGWLNNLGDDNELVLSDIVDVTKWNANVISKDLSEMGLHVTNAIDKDSSFEEFIDHNERVFLKRKNYYHPDLKRVVGLLDPKSIFRPFHLFIPSDIALPDYMIDIGRNFIKENFAYGREVYERNVPILLSAYDKCNLAIPEDFHISYDQRVELDKELYGDCEFPYIPNMPTVPQYDFDVTFKEETPMNIKPESQVEGIMESENAEAVTVAAPVSTGTMDMIPDNSSIEQSKFFSREIEIFAQRLPLNEGFEIAINPFYEYMRHSQIIQDKLNGYLFWSGPLQLRVTVSCTPFHSGAIMLTNTPHNKVDEYYQIPKEEFRNMIYSQRQHAVINLNRNNEIVMEIPFVNADPVAVFMDDAFRRISTVVMHTLVDFQHANNSSEILVVMYASMPKLKLHGASNIRMEMFLAKPAAKLGMKLASKIPGVERVLDVAGNAASVIGWGTSAFDNASTIMSPTVAPNLSTASDVVSKKLTLDPNQSVATDAMSVLGLDDDDEMSYDYLNSIPNILEIFPWSGNNDKDDLLYTLAVSPSNVRKVDDWVCMTSQAFVANNYRYWRGVMHYELEIVTVIGNGGKLQIFYEPYAEAGEDSIDILRQRSIVVDIKNTYKIQLSVNWQSMEALLFTKKGEFRTRDTQINGIHNGVIFIRVLSPLMGSGVNEPSAHIIVRQWASDMIYAVDDRDPFQKYQMYTDDPDWDPVSPYVGPISFIINRRCKRHPNAPMCRLVDGVRKFFQPGTDDDADDVDDAEEDGGTTEPGDTGRRRRRRIRDFFLTPWNRSRQYGATAMVMPETFQKTLMLAFDDKMAQHMNIKIDPGVYNPEVCSYPGSGLVRREWLTNEDCGNPDYINNKTDVVVDEPPVPTAFITREPTTRRPEGCGNTTPAPIPSPTTTKAPTNNNAPVPVKAPSVLSSMFPIFYPTGVPSDSAPSASPSDGHSSLPPVVTNTPAGGSAVLTPTIQPSLRPVTKAPLTMSPVTKAPTTKAPTTKAPVTKSPVTKIPVSSAPQTQAPVARTLKQITLNHVWIGETEYNISNSISNNTAYPSYPLAQVVAFAFDAQPYTFTVNFYDSNEKVAVPTDLNGGNLTVAPDYKSVTFVRDLIPGWNVLRFKFQSYGNPYFKDYNTQVPTDVNPVVTTAGGNVNIVNSLGTSFVGTALPYQMQFTRLHEDRFQVFGCVTDGQVTFDGNRNNANPTTLFLRYDSISSPFTGNITGTGAIIQYMYFQRNVRMESELEPMDVVAFDIGTPNNESASIIKVHIGERHTNLKQLGLRMRLETRIDKPRREDGIDINLPLYGQYDGSPSYLTYVSNSYLACRGSVTTMAHYEGNPATLSMFKPAPYWNEDEETEECGFEYTDTSINPNLTVTFPYQSQKRYETPRVLNLEVEDPHYRTIRVVTHPNTDDNTRGKLEVYSCFGTDYSAHLYLGPPILKKI